MEPRTLQFFVQNCGGRLVSGDPARVVQGVSTDSRTVGSGELFVALRGPNFDGHKFLEDVYDRGAAAAVVEESAATPLPRLLPCILVSDTKRAFGRVASAYAREFQLPKIAVVGSNGKTSTKELLHAVLSQKLSTLASAASFNNDVGVPATLLRLAREHRAAVFEVGTNHPGELRPLLEMIGPEAGVITSIGREHLEFFGDIEGVLEEEGTVAEVLSQSGFLVINGDAYGAGRLAERSRARVITAGFSAKNDWRIARMAMGPGGTHFSLDCSDRNFSGEYVTRLLGKHQVANATLAVVVGKELGLDRAEIQRGLASCPGAKMRLQLKQIDDFLVLDDAYNANADSMQAALETLRGFPCRGRRIAVLGDMAELGESSALAHEEVGLRAAEGLDCLVAVGQSSSIMAGAARRAGLRDVIDFSEVEKAGPAVGEMVRPGDVILVKASRAARLERVVDFLRARFGESSGPAPQS